jgi:hypothetical protein
MFLSLGAAHLLSFTLETVEIVGWFFNSLLCSSSFGNRGVVLFDEFQILQAFLLPFLAI